MTNEKNYPKLSKASVQTGLMYNSFSTMFFFFNLRINDGLDLDTPRRPNLVHNTHGTLNSVTGLAILSSYVSFP